MFQGISIEASISIVGMAIGLVLILFFSLVFRLSPIPKQGKTTSLVVYTVLLGLSVVASMLLAEPVFIAASKAKPYEDWQIANTIYLADYDESKLTDLLNGYYGLHGQDLAATSETAFYDPMGEIMARETPEDAPTRHIVFDESNGETVYCYYAAGDATGKVPSGPYLGTLREVNGKISTIDTYSAYQTPRIDVGTETMAYKNFLTGQPILFETDANIPETLRPVVETRYIFFIPEEELPADLG